jgi:hypothetical protein
VLCKKLCFKHRKNKKIFLIYSKYISVLYHNVNETLSHNRKMKQKCQEKEISKIHNNMSFNYDLIMSFYYNYDITLIFDC